MGTFGIVRTHKTICVETPPTKVKICPPNPEGSLAAELEKVDAMLDDVDGTVRIAPEAYRVPSPDGEVAYFIGSIREMLDSIESRGMVIE